MAVPQQGGSGYDPDVTKTNDRDLHLLLAMGSLATDETSCNGWIFIAPRTAIEIAGLLLAIA